ncbi:Ig-like domain-containing protein, partial [Acinetobacter baumannii]|nr:Ig-like domain-containing protein [Acinetobacter baumannii]
PSPPTHRCRRQRQLCIRARALAAGASANITFSFSAAVTGFDVSDIAVVGGPLGALTTTHNLTWTAVFTPDRTGTAPSISVADNT